MAEKYIDAKTFSEFCTNQEKLIGILNHNMTQISTDVSWIKKISLGVFSALILSFISFIIKIGLGI